MKFWPVMRNVLCAPAAAVCAALFTFAPSEALGQSAKSARAPHVFEHDGKRFAAYVDEKSGTATWIIDTDSLDFSLGEARSFSSKESVAAAANAFLDAHKDVFGIDTKQLSEPRVETNGAFWFIGYAQVYEKLRVLGAQAGVTITYDGRIVAAGARAFPKLDVQVGARISRAAAIASAQGQTTVPRTEAVVKQDLVIVPEEVADRYVFRLAWEVILENRDNDPPFSKTFLVDAHTGAIIAEYSNILDSHSRGQGLMRLALDEDARAAPAHAASSSSAAEAAIPYALPRAGIPEENIFGTAPPKPVRRKVAPSGTSTLSGAVTLNYYESPDSTHHPFTRRLGQAFPYAKVTVQNDATQETHVVYADADGEYEVTELADTTHTVTFEIANDKAYITDQAYDIDNDKDTEDIVFPMCQKEKSFSVEINRNTTLNHNWGWGDGGDGGLTAFALNSVYQIREMYDYFRNTYSYTGMESATYKIWIYENNKGRIYLTTRDYLGREYPKRIELGGPNAMSHDIVYHEFTHDVIYTLQGKKPPWSSVEYSAMHEGFSDYFPADKTNHFTFAGPLGRHPDTGMHRNTDPLEIVREKGTDATRFLWNECTMDDYDINMGCGENSHDRGRIISGAIWKIRKDKTRPVEHSGAPASRLLFDALQIELYATTFEELRDRYVAAARNSNYINYGDYAATIENRFAERRIGGPIMPGVPFITVDDETRNPKITWRDNSLIEDGYRVERKYNNSAWSIIADLDADTEAYADTTFQCNPKASVTNTYSYRIVPYKDYTEGIGIVSTESAAVPLYLNTCTTETVSRIAGASADAAMTDNIQLEEERKVPTGLEAPHPNPFNPVTTIRYGLAEEGPVRLTVYDMLGRRVAVLLDGIQTAGKHTVRFEASNLSSGMYFIVFDAGGKAFTKSVLLMK